MRPPDDTAAAAHQRAFLDGQAFVLQLSLSAVLSGPCFLAQCYRHGIAPATLSAARRQALDVRMAELFKTHPDSSLGAASQRLGALLLQADASPDS